MMVMLMMVMMMMMMMIMGSTRHVWVFLEIKFRMGSSQNCPSSLCGWSVVIFAAGMRSNQKCLSFHGDSIIRCSTTDRVKGCLCWSYLVSSLYLHAITRNSLRCLFLLFVWGSATSRNRLQRRILRFSRVTVFQLYGRSDFRWLHLRYLNWKLSMLSASKFQSWVHVPVVLQLHVLDINYFCCTFHVVS